MAKRSKRTYARKTIVRKGPNVQYGPRGLSPSTKLLVKKLHAKRIRKV